jgi:hypothetical protein
MSSQVGDNPNRAQALTNAAFITAIWSGPNASFFKKGVIGIIPSPELVVSFLHHGSVVYPTGGHRKGHRMNLANRSFVARS